MMTLRESADPLSLPKTPSGRDLACEPRWSERLNDGI